VGGEPTEQTELTRIVYKPKKYPEGEQEYQGHRKELPLRKHSGDHSGGYHINPDVPYEPTYQAPEYPQHEGYYKGGDSEEEQHEYHHHNDEEHGDEYKPKPHYGGGGYGGINVGGPNPGSLPTFDNPPCLNTVDQVAQAFSRGDMNR
jgi:hypothetical protein